MHTIDFYENEDGDSEVLEFIEELRKKKSSDKNARIQYDQVSYDIELLAQNGTILPSTVTKHLEDGIWELRSGRNRVFYFFYNDDDTYVLLHHFLKKTQKTPRREIERAKKERDDYISRKKEGRL